jgi:hypothetical protein
MGSVDGSSVDPEKRGRTKGVAILLLLCISALLDF